MGFKLALLLSSLLVFMTGICHGRNKNLRGNHLDRETELAIDDSEYSTIDYGNEARIEEWTLGGGEFQHQRQLQTKMLKLTVVKKFDPNQPLLGQCYGDCNKDSDVSTEHPNWLLFLCFMHFILLTFFYNDMPFESCTVSTWTCLLSKR